MIKYIVGIDFGHGETAAWAVPLSEDNEAKLPPSGASLRLRASNDAQDRQLPSVIHRTPEGEYSLEFKTNYGIITQMKKRVAKMSAIDKQNYSNYIHKIVERLKELNSDVLAFEDGEPIFRLCMASPTKWSDEEKKEYLSFFNSAIEDMGLRFDWIIDESDAAFFSHCKDESDMQKCTLVIDYGSSTIDYTAIQNGRIISEKSWSNQQLGASLIENSMMMTISPKKSEGYGDYSEMVNSTRQMLESHNLGHIDPEQVLGFELRKLKEEKYKQQTDTYKLKFDFEPITGDSDFESLEYVAKGNLSEVTREYQDAVRADLINLRNLLSQKLSTLNKTISTDSSSLTKEYRPDRIILSGGGKTMQWFYLMVKEVFSVRDIVIDKILDFEVAKGIALYAKRCYTHDFCNN